MDDRKVIKCRHGAGIFPCSICGNEKTALTLLTTNAKLLVQIAELKAENKALKEIYPDAEALLKRKQTTNRGK